MSYSINHVFKSFSLLIVFVVMISTSLNSQWDQYFATWEDKPGGVVLNMEWKKIAPVKELPFVVITTQRYFQNCREDGFPTEKAFDRLVPFSESILELISNTKQGEVVGYFTHNCEKRDYFYVADTSGVRESILGHAKDQAVLDGFDLKIMVDPEWKIYLNFLFPDDYLYETMVNLRAISEIEQAVDNIKKPVKMIHTAFFHGTDVRQKFRRFLLEQGFRIIDEQYQVSWEIPYQIRFSRKNIPDIETVNEVTFRLKTEARKLGGQYDGWEVELEK